MKQNAPLSSLWLIDYTKAFEESVVVMNFNSVQESDDLLGMGRYSAAPTPPPVGPRLGERGRSDWRRISVPERGKDFKSLPRKYNR